jgi:PKD repeat protein
VRRLTAVLITGWLLFSLSPLQVLADEQGRAGQGSASEHHPFAAGQGFSHQLPKGAAIGSTAERRAAWARLTPAQRQQFLQQFQALLGPALRVAAARHRGPRNPQGRWVMPDRLGRKIRAAAPAPAESGSRAFTDGSTEQLLIAQPEMPWPEPEPEPSDYPPVASASASPTSGYAPLTVQFYGSAYDPDGWIADYYWDFGDGGYSYDTSPVHTYSAPGTYFAWLSVTDNSGYSDFAAVTISVAPPWGNQPPSVSAAASPTSGTAPLAVSFNAYASDPDGYVASYAWDFGDGQGSSLAAPTHTYSAVGTYQARVTVTDNGGASASSGVAIQVNPPAGPDADGDGLADSFENALSDAFTPLYHVSTGELAGTGFSIFGDYVPQTPVQTFPPVPPISHYRVTPLGFSYDVYGRQLSVLQIDYFTLWNRDDGLSIGGDCWTFATVLGGLVGFSIVSALDGAGPHALDNERSAVLVAAPTTAAYQHPADPAAYSAYDFYTAAHEDTFFDHSMYFAPSQPVAAGWHVGLGMSRAKHGTYGFNPDHYALFPDWLIYATYDAIDFWYWYGYDPYDPYGWERDLKYLTFLYMADTLFFSCVVEHFGEQGGTYSGTRLNIGEVSHPLNGAGFIYDSRMIGKLTTPLWIVQ